MELKSVIEERILDAVHKSLQWDSGEITGIDMRQLSAKVGGILKLFKFSDPAHSPVEGEKHVSIKEQMNKPRFELHPAFSEDEYIFVSTLWKIYKSNPGTDGKKMAVAELREYASLKVKQEREKTIQECIDKIDEWETMPKEFILIELSKLKDNTVNQQPEKELKYDAESGCSPNACLYPNCRCKFRPTLI